MLTVRKQLKRNVLISVACLALSAMTPFAHAEKTALAKALPKAFVCPTPNIPCSSKAYKFEPYELSFANLPDELEWMTAHNSKRFYAIILASKKAIFPEDRGEYEIACGGYFSEEDRLEIQELFPCCKVFASRQGCSMVWYRNTNPEYNFIAVYAGQSAGEANEVLKKLKATGHFLDANVREMQVVVDNAH